MWIAFYNNAGIGDVLLLTNGPADEDHLLSESKNNITVIKNTLTDEIVSVNIFNISNEINIEGNGNVKLSQDQVDVVNKLIKDNGLEIEINVDNSSKFVVGYVEESEKLADSDHLTVTQTNVGEETLQIVCGASNIGSAMNVIVAKHGAVLPNGAIIWNGELRGVESQGMICSTRELNLTDIEDLPGIWEVEASFKPGTPLEEVAAKYR